MTTPAGISVDSGGTAPTSSRPSGPIATESSPSSSRLRDHAGPAARTEASRGLPLPEVAARVAG
ncbi:hypothetical protein [Kineosporia mesophila]|uniref:hypothetical protein n=1 Tax=Kineosporia mesophila TaxID=566012 RepID=UPI0031E7BA70